MSPKMTNPNYKNEEELKKNIEKGKSWTKSIKKVSEFKSTQCPEYDHIRDYHQDPSCYILVDIDRESKEIIAGICNYQNQLVEEFRGKIAQQIYYFMLNERKYITRLDHAAYLGKELKKAEMALATGQEYIQE